MEHKRQNHPLLFFLWRLEPSVAEPTGNSVRRRLKFLVSASCPAVVEHTARLHGGKKKIVATGHLSLRQEKANEVQ